MYYQLVKIKKVYKEILTSDNGRFSRKRWIRASHIWVFFRVGPEGTWVWEAEGVAVGSNHRSDDNHRRLPHREALWDW